jgi:hypothetical protein
MFGARFAVFVRRARVLPGPCHATHNFCFLRITRLFHEAVCEIITLLVTSIII